MSLAWLVSEASATDFAHGPVEYVDVDLGPNQQLACVKPGLYLVQDENGANLALLVAAVRDSYPPSEAIDEACQPISAPEIGGKACWVVCILNAK